MGRQSEFPHGFQSGVAIRGMPLLNSYPSKVLWVDSGASANSNGTFNRPFATLASAIASCDSAKGNLIMIKAGHAETLTTATQLAFNVAGITIIGLGTGRNRPTFTMGTIAGCTIAVSAANVAIQNCRFVAAFLDIVTVFTLTTAPGFIVDSCAFLDGTSVNFITIVTTTVAVVADGLVFTNNRISSLGTTAATTVIKIAGTHDEAIINDNFYVGGVVNNTAALLAHGALVVTNLEMSRNKVYRLTDTASGAILITTSATTNSGMVSDNYIKCSDAAGILLVTAGCKYGMFNNLVSGAADTSGFVLPAIDTDA